MHSSYQKRVGIQVSVYTDSMALIPERCPIIPKFCLSSFADPKNTVSVPYPFCDDWYCRLGQLSVQFFYEGFHETKI